MTSKKDKERVDKDVRPVMIWDNYDYTGSDEDMGPGGGFYHGSMDRYKSVKEFLEHSRKLRRNKRRQKLMNMASKQSE